MAAGIPWRDRGVGVGLRAFFFCSFFLFLFSVFFVKPFSLLVQVGSGRGSSSPDNYLCLPSLQAATGSKEGSDQWTQDARR